VFVQLFLCFCLLGRPLVTETLHALCSNTKIVKEAYSKGNIKKQLLKDHNWVAWYTKVINSHNCSRGGKNRRAREHCSQEMLNSCRKFLWMKICYWKFEGNLNTHVPLWAQQHMVDRHYSLNLKPWSARTLYVYAHADFSTTILRLSARNICLQVVLPGRKFFFPALTVPYLLFSLV
jgi:hypothetical protein